MRFEFGFLYSFTAVWLVTMLGSGAYLWWYKREWFQIDILLIGLIGGILGGRIDFVMQNSSYFQGNIDQIGQFFNGGIGYHGVVWGALLATALFCRIKQRSWSKQLANLTLFMPIWHTAGWAACWLDGCAYGQTAYIGWFTAELPDHLGVIAVRYQTQLAGLALSLCITLTVCLWFRTVDNRSDRFWLAFFLCQIAMFSISFWRGDMLLIQYGPVPSNGLFLFNMLLAVLFIGLNFLHHRTKKR